MYPPEVFWPFFPNGWEFLKQFFTHLFYVPIYAILQIYSVTSNYDEVMPY